MSGWRPLLRLAARDARRDRWRTVLVVALVALPVAGLGAVVGVADTSAATPEERVRDTHGDADLLIQVDTSDPALDVPTALAAIDDQLPEGAVSQPRSAAEDAMLHGGEIVPTTVTDDAPVEGTLAAPRHRLLEGRLPGAGAPEVVAYEDTAARYGLAVGDEVALRGAGAVTVVGIVRRLEALGVQGLLVAPGALDHLGLDRTIDVLVALPDVGTASASSVSELAIAISSQELAGGHPFWVETRADALGYRFGERQRFTAVVVGGLGAVEAALVAGAAFAVSVRRRQRELGLLAAVGATTGQVRRAVQLTGLVAGGLGALVGTAVAVGIVVAGMPLWQRWALRELAGPRLDPAWLSGVAVLGAASALVGAWWPARSVARLPVTVALAGRRPTTAPSSRGLAAGLVLVTAGCVVLVALVVAPGIDARGPVPYLVGAVLVVLGAGLASPWGIEQLARLAPRLPVGPRIALRDAARFRTRNGPIVTAAMAGLAATITITTIIGSMGRAEEARYEPRLADDQLVVTGPGADELATELAAANGGRSAGWGWAELQALRSDGDHLGFPALADPDLGALVAGDAGADALRAGQALVLGVEASSVDVVPSGWAGDGVEPAATFPATSVPLPTGVSPTSSAVPTVLLPRAEVDRLRADGTFPPASDEEVVSGAHLVVLPAPLDDAGLADAIARAEGLGVAVEAERGLTSRWRLALLGTLAVGAVAGLVLVAVALALASAEARVDTRTMAAVGASRATRRSLAAGRAALLAGLAGLLAVPVGLLPALALFARLRFPTSDLAVPWPALVTVLLVVPAVAALGAAAAAGREPRAIPRPIT
jgi:putative ABC transport system permease protein